MPPDPKPLTLARFHELIDAYGATPARWPEAERAEKRRKDLAVLARAGFDFDICRRALGSGNVADDEF